MPTSSIFLDPQAKEAIRLKKAEVSELLLDKQEKLQKKKPTKWKWSSLANAFKEHGRLKNKKKKVLPLQ